jgi:hypothetical protein
MSTVKAPQKEVEEISVPSTEAHTYDLAKPQEMMAFAKQLQRFVVDQQLSVRIQDRQYTSVEGWQYGAASVGLYPICTTVINESTYADVVYKWFDRRNNPHEVKTKHYKYRATVEIRRFSDDRLFSRGEMIATNEEFGKHDFAEYAVLSMAQTRAEGKALRMLLGWIMKAAGFEATPNEEMDNARKEFLENCPKPDEKRMLIQLVYSSTLDEAKRIEALATIAGCVDYDLFARIEARLRDLQPSIHETVNPSQSQINQHLRDVIARDES